MHPPDSAVAPPEPVLADALADIFARVVRPETTHADDVSTRQTPTLASQKSGLMRAASTRLMTANLVVPIVPATHPRVRRAADDVFRAMLVARRALRRQSRGDDEPGESDAEDWVERAAAEASANVWDGKVRGPARPTRVRSERYGRYDLVHEVVAVCEDGGELEMCTTNLGLDCRARRERARDGRPARRARPLVVWAHGMRGHLWNDDKEGLWNFWAREDLGEIAVARYNARGYGRSSDVRRAREARWDGRASDMIEVARRIRQDDGGEVVYAGTSLGGATAIWATVLAHECGTDMPKAVVIVTPPTFYEERESRKKKLKKKVADGVATENSTAPRRVFQAARDQPVDPAPPPLANPNDSCAVEVLIGSAQSNLPEPERVREAFANVPVLCLAWDCGDMTHPVSSAMTIKDLIPHAELVIATTKEDYDIVKHIREFWSGAIIEFIRRHVDWRKEEVVMRAVGEGDGEGDEASGTTRPSST